ncbi:hypothetical protein BOW53_04215 [Solemya pervernicosa gill symbiont]|uniref:Uncharacterized protein n=1 Tax=Solemya pervernicosa gill symbiont TaxID=642797 RepID=A0A1T2L899_9GAMM|nr:hypothetical protein [Solemya pervernicosa gill symbiont]OOZ41328.1 hypothetical protein BOW53_04215 [Solemya pervernicosa gill symbiont]
MDKIQDILLSDKTKWWSVKGLILGFVCALLASVAFNALIEDRVIAVRVFIIIAVSWMVIWISKNRIRKVSKGKVGILLCVYSKDEDVDERIREDFVSRLNEALISSDERVLVDVINVPSHIALRYDDFESACQLLSQAKAHFLLYGVVRKRGDQYILDMNARVVHRELNDDSKKKLRRDIDSAWIKRYKINGADETIELFEMSSEMVAVSSRYIIALAALASWAFDLSEILLINIKKELSNKSYPDLPAITEIKKGINSKLNSIYLFYAQRYLQIWVETRDESNIKIMEDILNKVIGFEKRSGQVLTGLAIASLVLRSDIRKSEAYMNKIKKKYRDKVWFLNQGFLSACQSNERQAQNNYDVAIGMNESGNESLSLEKISEFEDFMCWYINDGRGNSLHKYLLAVLNDKIKGDVDRARIDYLDFLDKNIDGSNPLSVKNAISRLSLLE